MDMITLEKPVLAALLVNATHEVDMGDGRRATIYYETDRLAHMRRPDGVVMTGDWSLLDDGYAIEWRGPGGDLEAQRLSRPHRLCRRRRQ